MRLMVRDIEYIGHYRKESKESPYIGTVSKLAELGTLRGVVNPVTDSVSVELYGERVHGMVSITVLSGNALKIGDILRISGVDYKVLSIAHYTLHDIVTAERTDSNAG